MAENEKRISNPLFDRINNPEDSKKRLVTALIMTKSFVNLETLREVLSEEQHLQLEAALKADVESLVEKINPTWLTKEKLEEGKKLKINRELVFGHGKAGRIELQEIMSFPGSFNFPIDPESINELELAKLVEKAMEKHLSYNVFHSNPFLSKEQLQEALRYYIDVAREIQGKEPKYQGQEKQVEKTEEEKPKERAGEEQEIEAMLAQKRELEAKITELDSKIAEARAKEAQLKGGQEQTGKPEQEDEGR